MYKYSFKPLNYFELSNFENLLRAHQVARCGKRHKRAVIQFEQNLFENLYILENELKTKTYKVGEYKTFYIYEPKKREIQALGYRDRIVQHTICDNYLTPYYKNRLIYANCACQEGKGSYFARQLLKKYMVEYHKRYGENGYFLKCDVKKYFANINHQILKNQLQKLPDKDIVDLLGVVLDSYHYDTQKGLPIGNQISQILGVAYMDSLDRLIKEKLNIKFYVRYMDDLIILHHDKEYLKYCLQKINCELQKLDLEFNSKTHIFPISQGVEFLGGRFSVLKSGKILIKVKKQSRQRYNKSIKSLRYLKKNNLINQEYLQSAYAGHKGHFKGFDANKIFLKFAYEFLQDDCKLPYI